MIWYKPGRSKTLSERGFTGFTLSLQMSGIWISGFAIHDGSMGTHLAQVFDEPLDLCWAGLRELPTEK